MSKPIAFFLLTLFVFSSTTEWKLEKDDENIQVYTRNIEGETLKQFKGKVELDNSIQDIINAVMDVDLITDIYADTESYELIEESADGKKQSIYIETAAPWPADNRDGCYTSTVIEIIPNKEYKIEIEVTPDLKPEKEDLVRIKKGGGHWYLKALDNGNTQVVYQYLINPGGNVPDFIANTTVVKIPFETLSNLREVLSKK